VWNEDKKEKGYTWNVQTMHDYYSSNGWMVGKSKMKDWKASMRNWNTRQKEYNNKQQAPTTLSGVVANGYMKKSCKEFTGGFAFLEKDGK
jgi:hypothetical protein